MSDAWSIANRWADIAIGRSEKGQVRNARSRVIASGDHIFSYGSHFEMARVVRDRKGKPEMFLINGDTFSMSTSRHQSIVRGVIRSTELPSVIIPHQALNAAGIDLDTVHILDVSRDKTVTTDHVAYERPPGSRWKSNEVAHYREYTEAEIAAKLAALNAANRERWEEQKGWAERARESAAGYWQAWLANNPEPVISSVQDVYLGNGVRVLDRVEQVLHLGWREVAVEQLDDGRTEYRWTTMRHWLGESLIQATLSWTNRTRCKGCRGSGRAEGPVAIHDWLPGGRVLCPDCSGLGWHRQTRKRTAKFLSGFDANERRRSYFFCELPPKATATTIQSAYDALKPDSVHLAEQMGRTVKRQGDIFAIPLVAIDKRGLRAQGARFEKRGQLFGTNHEGTEVAYLPDGNTLVRGVLYHAPANRRPDHARCRLGDVWHVVAKNLVPIGT